MHTATQQRNSNKSSGQSHETVTCKGKGQHV
jgi:hypothetical protein